jgi:hypothetical protein
MQCDSQKVISYGTMDLTLQYLNIKTNKVYKTAKKLNLNIYELYWRTSFHSLLLSWMHSITGKDSYLCTYPYPGLQTLADQLAMY